MCKKTIILMLLMLLFPLLYTSANEVPFYESEPNDNFRDATVIPENGRIAGFLQEGNTDCFFWTVAEDNSMVFNITLEPARDSDPFVEVISPDKKIIIKSDMRGFGVTERIAWLRLTSGRYVIRIQGMGTNIKSPYYLNLEQVTAPGLLEHEPNNTITSAVKLESGKSVHATLIPGDRDFFLVESDALPRFLLDIFPYKESVGNDSLTINNQFLSMDILSSKGDFIKGFENIELSFFRKLRINIPDKSVILSLRSDSTSLIKYTITETFCDLTEFEAESNDMTENAVPLYPLKGFTAEAFPASDVDWFSVSNNTGTPGTYTLSVTSKERCFDNARVVLPKLKIEKTFQLTEAAKDISFTIDRDTSPAYIIFSAGPNRTEYLRSYYSGTKNDQSMRKQYRLELKTVKSVKENHEAEINDFPVTSEKLTLQGHIQGHIAGPDDVDCFLIERTEDNVFDLRLNIEFERHKKISKALEGSFILPPASIKVTALLLTENNEIAAKRDITLYSGETIRKVSLKFFNLVSPKYYLKLFSKECLTSGISYSIKSKIWEIKKFAEPDADALPWELTFFVGDPGFDFVVLGTGNNQFSRYYMNYHPLNGSAPLFTGGGKIISNGLFFNQNRFNRTGFYTIQSEHSIHAAGINSVNQELLFLTDPAEKIKTKDLDTPDNEITPAYSLFFDLISNLTDKISINASGSEFTFNSGESGFSGVCISSQQLLALSMGLADSKIGILVKDETILEVVLLGKAEILLEKIDSELGYISLLPFGREAMKKEIFKGETSVELMKGKNLITIPYSTIIKGFKIYPESRLGFLSFKPKQGSYKFKADNSFHFSPCLSVTTTSIVPSADPHKLDSSKRIDQEKK